VRGDGDVIRSALENPTLEWDESAKPQATQAESVLPQPEPTDRVTPALIERRRGVLPMRSGSNHSRCECACSNY
jgi:hypothetical protein